MSRVILLDATYEPMGIISWKKAFYLIYQTTDSNGKILEDSKATVLWSYPDKKIRSQHCQFDWPAMIVLKKPSKRKRNKRVINPSTKSILIRDMYTCQYCGVKLTGRTGTKDHVIPQSKGGDDSWENLVAACRTCQNKKDNKLSHECGLYPKNKPKTPSYKEKFRNSILISNSNERKTWLTGLKKLNMMYLIDCDTEDDIDTLKESIAIA
jgi:5-methylcytosine-specific restriction endonuclease McrA